MPIGRPSTAVKPIVLATLRPLVIAHMLEPLPRCSTTTLPRGGFRVVAAAKPARCTRRRARGIRSVLRRASVIDRGSANACATSGWARWNAVSKQAT